MFLAGRFTHRDVSASRPRVKHRGGRLCRFAADTPQVAVDRGFGDVQFPGDLSDGALGLEYALRFQRAEYLQLVGGMHGIGGDTIAEDGGVDQIAGQLRDGIVQIFGIGGALLLLRKRKGMEQVGEMLREHQNILHIVVHADQPHQMTLFLNEIGGRDETLTAPGAALVVGHIVVLLIDSGSQQFLGQLRHGVTHAAAAEMLVAGGNHRALRRGNVMEDDLIILSADLSHKFVALFGCGDSDSYSDTFCDGIGILYEDLKDTGCTFIGITDTAGYTFDASVAVVNGKFVGLPIDEVNEDSQTDQRIDQWVEGLKKEIN